MRQLLYLFLLLPGILLAQQKGIVFQNGLSFQQGLAMAKAEKKFLFVCSYANMDDVFQATNQDVFVKENVGNYINAKFVSLSIQADALANRYGPLKDIQTSLAATGYPAYLFFSPEGKLVHRGGGYKDADGFVKLAMEAQSPATQYYTLLEKYYSGKKDYAAMPYLIGTARAIKDGNANSLSKDYLDNYLATLSREKLFTERNITFLATAIHSGDKLFKSFLDDAKVMDSVMNRIGFAQTVVDKVVTGEEIDPKLWKNARVPEPLSDKPDWERIAFGISRKYGSDYAVRTILNAKLKWYATRKEWPEYCETVIVKAEKLGPYGFEGVPDDVKWNELAWDLFNHSSDKEVLMKALSWSDSSMKLSSISMAGKYDTYANLLYKLGRKQEAISWEEKAVLLDPSSQDIRDTLEKMKKGERTWRYPEKENSIK